MAAIDRPCYNHGSCPYRTVRKTKYGEYDWCKKFGCSTSSPKKQVYGGKN